MTNQGILNLLEEVKKEITKDLKIGETKYYRDGNTIKKGTIKSVNIKLRIEDADIPIKLITIVLTIRGNKIMWATPNDLFNSREELIEYSQKSIITN